MSWSQAKPQSKKNRVRRALAKQEPKNIEDPKIAMFVKGTKTSNAIRGALENLYMIKKPEAVNYVKRNEIKPFDDATSLEFFARKSDASLFAHGSHSKKRPNNLILGRMFNYSLLDMVEFGVDNFKSMDDFAMPGYNVGSKTCIVFQGQEFDTDPTFQKIANLLLDFFCNQNTDQVNLMCLDHVVICTSHKDKIFFRHYLVELKRSGNIIPRVELKEIGPHMDLTLRRTKFASDDLEKVARQRPVLKKKGKQSKNTKTNELMERTGTIHMGNQNIYDLQAKRPKALRNVKAGGDTSSAATDGAAEGSAASGGGGRKRPLERATSAAEAKRQKKHQTM